MNDKASPDELRGLRAWSAAIRLWRHDGAEILAEHGLTWSGFDVLLALLDGPRRSGQLCNELGMTTGGMAKLLKRLESVNVIERRRGEEEDLRAVTVQLTPKGRTLIETAGNNVLTMRQADYQQWDITPEMQAVVTAVWEKLRAHAAR